MALEPIDDENGSGCDGLRRVYGQPFTDRILGAPPFSVKTFSRCGGCGSPRPPRKRSKKQKAYNAKVKKVMRETGMSLPEASRWLKQNGY